MRSEKKDTVKILILHKTLKARFGSKLLSIRERPLTISRLEKCNFRGKKVF